MSQVWYIKDGVFSRIARPGAAEFSIPDDAVTHVIIPTGVQKIDANAFRACHFLTGITLPDTVICIGDGAFFSCDNLVDVTLSGSLATIGTNAFGYCTGLSGIIIPDSVTTIGDLAFHSCRNLTGISIPHSVRSIGEWAFQGCNSLTDVVISEGVTTIGQWAFCGCSSLTRINIPDSVTRLGDRAFDGYAEFVRTYTGTPAIRHLYVHTWNKVLNNHLVDGILIHTDILSSVPAQKRAWAAAAFCEDSRTFDDPVGQEYAKYMRTNAAKIVSVALACPALMQTMLREKLLAAKDIDAYHAAAQAQGDTALIAQLLEYQTGVLTSDKVTKVRARKAAALESQQEQVIDRAASRAQRTDLANLVFVVSGSLKTFGARKELQTLLESYGARLAASVTSKTDYLITNNPAFDSEKISKAAQLGVEVIDEKRLNELLFRRFTNATEVVIPDWITEIADEAFKWCSTLTGVTLSDSVTRIGRFAFAFCTNLTTVNMPSRMTEIGESAFVDCRSLLSIIIPDSVTTIGKSAFTGCKNLTLHAPAGSYAEAYARENALPFAAL